MADELFEQVFKLGEQVMFKDDEGTWMQGTVCDATLYTDAIYYGAYAESGYSEKRLAVGEQIRPLSAVVQLGRIVDV